MPSWPKFWAHFHAADDGLGVICMYLVIARSSPATAYAEKWRLVFGNVNSMSTRARERRSDGTYLSMLKESSSLDRDRNF